MGPENHSEHSGYRHGHDIIPACFACATPIRDAEVFVCDEQNYHEDCLTCSVCAQKLDRQCHVTQSGQLLCLRDHLRLSNLACAGCDNLLKPTDEVHRVHSNMYHKHCFRCLDCDVSVIVGEELYLQFDGKIICGCCYNARF